MGVTETKMGKPRVTKDSSFEICNIVNSTICATRGAACPFPPSFLFSHSGPGCHADVTGNLSSPKPGDGIVTDVLTQTVDSQSSRHSSDQQNKLSSSPSFVVAFLSFTRQPASAENSYSHTIPTQQPTTPPSSSRCVFRRCHIPALHPGDRHRFPFPHSLIFSLEICGSLVVVAILAQQTLPRELDSQTACVLCVLFFFLDFFFHSFFHSFCARG